MPVCTYCGAAISAGQSYCAGCGKPVYMNPNVCSKCGYILTDGVHFCPRCGQMVDNFCRSCGSRIAVGSHFCRTCGASNSPAVTVIPRGWAWVLAVSPLEYLGFIHLGLPVAVVFAILTLLNMLYVLLDIRQLKKCSGLNLTWTWTGFFIIPLYLFLRASRTDLKYSYAIAWLICVVLATIILAL